MTRSPWDDTPHARPHADAERTLREAGLGWDVVRLPLYAENEGVRVRVPHRDVVVRSDTGGVLAVATPLWRAADNKTAYDRMVAVAREGAGHLELVGSLRNGKIAWGLVDNKSSFEVDEDVIESKTLVSVSREYGRTSDVRYVGLARRTRVSYVSRPAALARVQDIAAIMRARALELEDAARMLDVAGVDEPTARAFIQKILGPRPAARAFDAATKLRLPMRTWWDVLVIAANAVDYELGYGIDTRLTSSWYGINRARREKILTEAVRAAAKSDKVRRRQPAKHK